MNEQRSNNSSKKNAVYKVAATKYLSIFLGIFFSIIMARMLSPEDYGIFAVVNALAGYIMNTSNLGIGAAIIQKKNLSVEEIECIYSFTGVIGIILGAVMVILGAPLSKIYNNDVYYVLCQLLAVSVLLYSVNLVPNALLLRDERYNQVALRNLVVSIGSMVPAFLIAAWGGKYYALIGQNIANILIYYVWNVFTAKIHFRVNIKATVGAVKKIFRYSIFSFGGDTAGYLELNIDSLMIGPVLGSTPLGIYDKAYRLLDYPVGNLAGTLNTILHPLLKEYQDQPAIIKDKYEKIEKFFSLVSIFIITVCFSCSKEIIHILFGEKWDASVVVFQIMILALYPKMLMATVNAVFSSLGDTKILFISQVKRTFVVFCGVFAGVMCHSIENVAFGIVAASWFNLIIIYRDLCRCNFNISKKSLMKMFGPDLFYMISISLVMFFFNYIIDFENNFLSALVKGILLGVCFLAYLIISRNIYSILDILPDKFKKASDKIKLILEVYYK